MISQERTVWPLQLRVCVLMRTRGFPGPIMVQLWSTYRSSGILNVSPVAIRIASFQ
jgi:hypothetical protein